MNKRLTITIEESDLNFKLYYSKSSIKNCFNRITDIIYKDFIKSNINRYITAIAGPPGCGKSSIAHLLGSIIKKDFQIDVTVLPLDGFHYKNEYLKSVKIRDRNRTIPLLNIKGAPETYNLEYFKNCVENLIKGKNFYWPIYSRKIHEPIENGIEITDGKKIYIIEGNYLLLDEAPWKDISKYYSKKIFILSPIRFLRKRVINRKIAGGFSKEEAKNHFKNSDIKNIKRVLNSIADYDILIKQKGKYNYRILKANL